MCIHIQKVNEKRLAYGRICVCVYMCLYMSIEHEKKNQESNIDSSDMDLNAILMK